LTVWHKLKQIRNYWRLDFRTGNRILRRSFFSLLDNWIISGVNLHLSEHFTVLNKTYRINNKQLDQSWLIKCYLQQQIKSSYLSSISEDFVKKSVITFFEARENSNWPCYLWLRCKRRSRCCTRTRWLRSPCEPV
jgi:hypothetical protein